MRSTQDIDLVIDPDRDALNRFADDVERRGWYVDPIRAAAEFERRGMFNVIDFTSGWKIDLILRKDRPFSSVEFSRRIESHAFGPAVFIATAEDSILSKLEWAHRGGSDRQLGDAAAIIRLRGDLLDVAYIDEWADQLGVESELRQARQLAERQGS